MTASKEQQLNSLKFHLKSAGDEETREKLKQMIADMEPLAAAERSAKMKKNIIFGGYFILHVALLCWGYSLQHVAMIAYAALAIAAGASIYIRTSFSELNRTYRFKGLRCEGIFELIALISGLLLFPLLAWFMWTIFSVEGGLSEDFRLCFVTGLLLADGAVFSMSSMLSYHY